VGSLLIISLVIFILINKIRQQRREEQRKRLALQVLTHEFRTPIASMLLQMERVQGQFLTLNDDLQECFLRLSNDVFRLQRLTETSRNYLKIQSTEGLLEKHEDEVASLNDYVSEQIETYIEGEKGNFAPLEKDREAKFDSYWISICIKNILENAKIHGIPPISILLKTDEDFWTVEIKDEGECFFTSLEEITSEFVKGEKSSGTGLGLNIVRKVLYDMGGKLKFSINPTKFELSIPWNGRNVKKKFGIKKL
jgi:signal transduction histidine kinase